MARDVTQALRQAVYAQESDQVLLRLLTIDDPSLPEPRRYVADHVPCDSRGHVFQPAAFRIGLPRDAADAPPRVTLDVDAVDREMIRDIREFPGRPEVTLEFVLASDPDVVEIALYFQLGPARYTAQAVQVELVYEPILDEPIPADSYTPNLFPGLFR